MKPYLPRWQGKDLIGLAQKKVDPSFPHHSTPLPQMANGDWREYQKVGVLTMKSIGAGLGVCGAFLG